MRQLEYAPAAVAAHSPQVIVSTLLHLPFIDVAKLKTWNYCQWAAAGLFLEPNNRDENERTEEDMAPL